MMNRFKKSQILMLSLLTALLFVTPLISSSLRPKYLYFIFNLLIIALGAEAGLLPALSKPSLEDKKHSVNYSSATKAVATKTPQETNRATDEAAKVAPAGTEKKKAKVVEKCSSEKIVSASAVKVEKVKKCPSMPSLFFIGGGEAELVEDAIEEHDQEEEEDEAVGGLSGQELFTQAETFIGNFYKQLKMQREDSWKRIHGFYQKAF